MREDPVEILQKIFTELALTKDLQNELLQLVEILYKDLESSRNTNNNLQQQILGLIREETFGITSKYTALKEEHANLKHQLETVKNENVDLNTQLLERAEELKKIAAEKEQEMHHLLESLTKQKEEEIKQKENELQALKQSHEARVKQLHTEIESAGAFSAMQLDQAQLSHKKQVTELNKKLKESRDTCNVLRSELFNAKEQCNEYKSKILELQQSKRISSTETSLRNQEKSWSSRSSDPIATPENNNVREQLWYNGSGTVGKSNTSLPGRYEPLEVTSRNNSSSDNRSLVESKPPTYRSTPKFIQYTPPKVAKKNAPPLMKVSEGKNSQEKPPVKKRKLYNPEDWTYLSMNHGSLSQ